MNSAFFAEISYITSLTRYVNIGPIIFLQIFLSIIWIYTDLLNLGEARPEAKKAYRAIKKQMHARDAK